MREAQSGQSPAAHADVPADDQFAADDRFAALRASLQQQHRREQKRVTRDRTSAYQAFARHETEHGPAYVRRTTFSLDHRHGHASIAEARDICGETLADLALDDSLRDVDSHAVLYVDTETTGLAGGAGTIPFLTGLSWFEPDAFVVLQVVVLDPGEERAALHLLADRLRERRALVSFNGKSFDWPLLRTRFLLSRVACQTPSAHLDLLHVSRRVFAHEAAPLPDRRLQTLEQHVLGFAREDDLPGAEVPEVYRRFLRERDVSLLEPILEHNLHDLVALPALLSHCAASLRASTSWGNDAADLCAGRLWALAKLRARRGQTERALCLAKRCAEQTEQGEMRVQALLFSARLERRRKNFAQQERYLKEAVACAPPSSWLEAEVHLAYAKFLEHYAKRYEDALRYANSTAVIEGEAGNAKRLARLKRRQRAAADQGA